MKQLLMLILALGIGGGLFAQENTVRAEQIGNNAPMGPSLRFLGIDISGPLDKFCAQLEERGFLRNAIADNGADAVLSGSLEGHDCNLSVYTSARSHTVFLLRVAFAPTNDWGALIEQYDRFLAAIKPLGITAPFDYCEEGFAEGDGQEFEGVERGRITKGCYLMNFDYFGAGQILLHIEANEGRGWLSLEFMDLFGSHLHDTEIRNSL